MTVSELQKILENHPGDMEVRITTPQNAGYNEINEIYPYRGFDGKEKYLVFDSE